MGQSHNYSHLNVWALSTLIHSKVEDIENILLTFENAKNVNEKLIAASKYLPDTSSKDGMMDLIEEQKLYFIHENEFDSLIKYLQISESDCKVFIDMFRLIDIRGSNIINLKDAIIALSPITCRSLKECFSFCFTIYDRSKSGVVDKQRMVHFLKILNTSLGYCGDKELNAVQIYDLVDSVYTSAGLIDGPLFYASIIESLATHPIVEMMLSPQFQGSMRNKVVSTEQINALINEI